MARDPFQISIAVPFEEAIAAARRRRVVLPEVFYGHLPAAARSRAFTVSGLAALDQGQGVMDSLAAATESGQTFRDWKKRVLEDVPAVAALPRDRLDNIFRTAIQTHYNVGRWEQLEGNKARRPYLMYDAINDGRTRPAHREMDNHIAPIDDPIWNRWYPPNGFNSLLPEQRVSGAVRLALKAWYSGPVVDVETRLGGRVSVTAQHPILTRRGWVPAKDVGESDQLVAYGGIVGPGAVAADLDENDPPPTIEQVFETLRPRAARTLQRAALNLNGDVHFIDGDVEIVGADGELLDEVESASRQFIMDFTLARANGGLGSGACPGGLGVISRGLDGGPGGAESRRAPPLGGALPADVDPVLAQVRGNLFSAFPDHPGDVASTEPAAVQTADVVGHRLADPSRGAPHRLLGDQSRCVRFGVLGNTALAEIFVGGFEVNPDALSDILEAHPGAVEFDDVLRVTRRDWSGHVYDLETLSGNILAYGNAGSRHYVVSNCRCSVIALTEAQARARGYGTRPTPDAQPDKGWDYHPAKGQDEALRKVIQDRRNQCGSAVFAQKRGGKKIWCSGKGAERLTMIEAVAKSGGAMPEPRSSPRLERLSEALDERALFAMFMREFGGGTSADFVDVLSETLEISRALFLDARGHWKIRNRKRAIWLLYTALNIREPDEIWLAQDQHDGPDKRYYLSRFDVGLKDLLSCVAVFERDQGSKGVWSGRTNYATTREDAYIQSKRRGGVTLKYRRWEQ